MIYNFSANFSITVSHIACMHKNAIESKGVFYKLTITNFFFFPATIAGISAAGVTLKELPNDRHTSAFFEFKNPSFISFSGKFSPKFIIESYNFPPQPSTEHILPVSCECTFAAFLTLKSRKYFLLHF